MSLRLDIEQDITIGEFIAYIIWKEPAVKIIYGKTDEKFVYKDDRDTYKYKLNYVAANDVLSLPQFLLPVCACNRARVSTDKNQWRLQPIIPLKNNEDKHKLENWFIDIIFPSILKNPPQKPFGNIPCTYTIIDAYFQELLTVRLQNVMLSNIETDGH